MRQGLHNQVLEVGEFFLYIRVILFEIVDIEILSPSALNEATDIGKNLVFLKSEMVQQLTFITGKEVPYNLLLSFLTRSDEFFDAGGN